MAFPNGNDLDSLVMLTPHTADHIAVGLARALGDLNYIINDLADTGDYTPADIEQMKQERQALEAVQDGITRYFKAGVVHKSPDHTQRHPDDGPTGWPS